MAKEKKDGSAENSGENKEQEKRGRVENIIAYQFKPGESGNPGGRPRKVLSDAYTALMDQKFPGDARGARPRNWSPKARRSKRSKVKLTQHTRLVIVSKARCVSRSS